MQGLPSIGEVEWKSGCVYSFIGYASLFYILLFIYNFVNIRVFTKLLSLCCSALQETLSRSIAMIVTSTCQ